MADRWQFGKIGLGYRCWSDKIETEFRMTRIRRSRGDLTGELAIKTNIKDIKTQDDRTLIVTRLNVFSSTSKASLAKLLGTRSPGQDMDWFDGIERLCQGIILAEQQGEETVEVGSAPARPRSENFLVEPLILKNRASMLFGPGGVGKSLTALACGLSVAVGREIIPGVAPAAKGNVLYLDWEEDWDTLNQRIQAIAKGHDFKPGGMFYRRCRVPLADDVEELAGIVAEKKILLVIVDSAAQAMGPQGEYGDANEATLRMHAALRLMDTSSQIIDHVNKTEARSKGGTASPYGSAYKTNQIRMSWEVRKAPSNGTQKISLFHSKSNSTAILDPLGLELDWTDDTIRFRPSAVTEAMVAPEPSMLTIREQILEYMDDNAKRYPDVIAKDLNLNPSSVRVKLRELDKEGRMKTEAGLYWKERTIVNFPGSEHAD